MAIDINPPAVVSAPAPDQTIKRRPAWIAHLAGALCYLGAVWLIIHDGLTLSVTRWQASALEFPLLALGLMLAGLWWLTAGLRDKGWIHVVASVLFALPKIYNLPTDMFGLIPAVLVSLALGVYVHIGLARDYARLAAAGILPVSLRPMLWLPVALLVLVALHVMVDLSHAALEAAFLALQ